MNNILRENNIDLHAWTQSYIKTSVWEDKLSNN